MNVHIYRGQNQIGGSIIEVSTETTRILLDVGLELDNEKNRELPKIEGLFDSPTVEAVFISHYHGDHLGLAYYIDKRIPLYIGKASYKIVKAADDYKNTETISPAGFIYHNHPITIGDITVTAFLCDHSAFDSYMILCESGGERILYTGDFRSNGRKPFGWLLSQLPHKVDKLICEGTTLTRDSYDPVTESELEEAAVKEFRSTDGPIFVMQSSTNIDRIVTMYRAAKLSGRVFLEELYMAEITSAIGGSIPNPAFSDVYAFITNGRRYETLTKYKNRISKEHIGATRFVMCVRSSMLKYIKSLAELMPFEKGLLVYSMWGGYKMQPEMKAFLDECKRLGLRIVDLHTSGHADPDTIKRVIEWTNPKEIIPIHTENPAWFSKTDLI
ncbi:MBL fold metallo-hydrolase [Acetanaerobacterium elongatum]|uniref:Ribonuclease J n=1 Tax=Acetanaerobacterium elongatum TaxID=258515 RepID=A0A1G9U8H9_9FIRM|nr:MBL fold metallo-hydrolase [Acetanaerobacterium elongatum]SDM56241.1 ribonuclease J [Acetanaerobacterium elongatum]